MEVLQTYVHKGRELHLTAYQGTAHQGSANASAAPEGTQRPAVLAPGAGHFEFGDLRAEWQEEVLVLTGRVSGHNLAYLYTEVLLKDPGHDRFYGPVTREYIRAERNEGTSGITRPAWGDSVDIKVRIRPLLRLLTDGANYAFCFALAEGYTSPGYRQGGLYTPAGATEPLRALLGFSGDGNLKRAIAYAEQDRRSGPKVLTPGQGDRFVPFAQVFTPLVTEGEWEITSAVADPLTLGSYPLRVVTERAVPGEYLVGVLAQDLDGGLFRHYVAVSLSG
jgi:hypothetical protein